jgi:hypothetical protein
MKLPTLDYHLATEELLLYLIKNLVFFFVLKCAFSFLAFNKTKINCFQNIYIDFPVYHLKK